jgi:hypothetical protein
LLEDLSDVCSEQRLKGSGQYDIVPLDKISDWKVGEELGGELIGCAMLQDWNGFKRHCFKKIMVIEPPMSNGNE